MSVIESLNNAGTNRVATLGSRWFSPNPDRAWAEKFFLLYSPVWMALMALMMLTGWVHSFSDSALLLHAALVALPLLVFPMLLRAGKNPGARWYRSYWFKANLYIWIFNFFGNYFGSEYFFDVLGMVYRLPHATTVLDSKLVGHSGQKVPFIMYLYTQAYFMTYHTSAIVVLRRLMSAGVPWARLAFMPSVFLVGYAWAWLETKAMANPLMSGTFYYENMPAMLSYGSVVYSTYFIGSFPIFYFLDENAGRRWDLFKVASAALSASMIVFYLLEICAYFVEHL